MGWGIAPRTGRSNPAEWALCTLWQEHGLAPAAVWLLLDNTHPLFLQETERIPLYYRCTCGHERAAGLQSAKCPACVLWGPYCQSHPEALTSDSVKRRRPKKLVMKSQCSQILPETIPTSHYPCSSFIHTAIFHNHTISICSMQTRC
jgi:hypothetical protein